MKKLLNFGAALLVSILHSHAVAVEKVAVEVMSLTTTYELMRM